MIHIIGDIYLARHFIHRNLSRPIQASLLAFNHAHGVFVSLSTDPINGERWRFEFSGTRFKPRGAADFVPAFVRRAAGAFRQALTLAAKADASVVRDN